MNEFRAEILSIDRSYSHTPQSLDQNKCMLTDILACHEKVPILKHSQNQKYIRFKDHTINLQ
jgi:hypothetical protein